MVFTSMFAQCRDRAYIALHGLCIVWGQEIEMSRFYSFLNSRADRAAVALIARLAAFDHQVVLASNLVAPMDATS